MIIVDAESEHFLVMRTRGPATGVKLNQCRAKVIPKRYCCPAILQGPNRTANQTPSGIQFRGEDACINWSPF